MILSNCIIRVVTSLHYLESYRLITRSPLICLFVLFETQVGFNLTMYLSCFLFVCLFGFFEDKISGCPKTHRVDHTGLEYVWVETPPHPLLSLSKPCPPSERAQEVAPPMPTGYLNCLLGTGHGIFWSPHLLSNF